MPNIYGRVFYTFKKIKTNEDHLKKLKQHSSYARAIKIIFGIRKKFKIIT